MFHHDRLRTHAQRLLPLLLAMWLVALVPAARKLMAFEWNSGATGPTPTHLTNSASTGLAQDEGHLIVAIHPLCSCTQATLAELVSSAATWKQPVHSTFLVYTAKSSTADNPATFNWRNSASIREAQRALNAEVVEDINGEQAAKLGALTSGEVLFYSAPDRRGARHLLFSGGVTAGRGMEGENSSIATLSKAISDHSINTANTPPAANTPVYGCGLAALSNPTPGGSAK